MDTVVRIFKKLRKGGYEQCFDFTTFDIIFNKIDQNTEFGKLTMHLRNAFTRGLPTYEEYESPSDAKAPIPKEVLKIKTELPKLSVGAERVYDTSKRHYAVARHFIANDPFTVGTEVPVWLDSVESPNNKAWYGFIDIVRFKSGRLQIVDFKPEIPNSSIYKFGIQVLRYMYMIHIRTGIPMSLIDGYFFNDKHTYQVTPKIYG